MSLEARSRIYVIATTVVALATLASLITAGYRFGTWWVVLALAAVAAVSERGRVRLSNNLEESISLIPTLFVAVLFGPLSAMAVGAASYILELRRPYLRWASWTSTRSITGAITGIVASQAARFTGNSLASIAVATTVGACATQVLDIGFGALAARVRGTAKAKDVLRTLAPLAAAAVPLYTPVVAFLAFAYGELSPLTLPLFFVPALAAQRLFALYQDQRRLTEDLVSVNTQLARANMSFATALVATLDARDRYTAGHSAAVAIYARDIAARMDLSSNDQQLAHLCGLVHDIGKIGLPAGLLEKPGALTLEERRQMERHSAIGERILAKVDDYAEIAGIVRHHHERIDGHGYPDGRTGADIPLLSRVIAVADAYNAMTSDRPYRDAMPSRVARLRLAQAVETQFDTTVVAAFEAILAGASETYRSGSRPDFSLEAQDRYSGTTDVEVA